MPGIYVEINIQCPMEDLWAKTQTPELHQQWDLRFSDISYLPRPDESQPQRFRYATRVGFGIAIVGEGETVAAQEADGSRTSALKFWSTDTRSLIREGSGYWKYIPTTNGIRFLTWYDYTVRFGLLGRCFDAAVFRPLMGWATAWSFDRLRRWLEEGLDPAVALRQSLIYGISRIGVAFTWIYHGLVPKLLFSSSDEVLMLTEAGISSENLKRSMTALGVAEIVFGLSMLLFWRARSLSLATCVLMALALAGVAIESPHYLTAAFNPVTLNAAMIALSLIGLVSRTGVPSACRCKRKKDQSAS